MAFGREDGGEQAGIDTGGVGPPEGGGAMGGGGDQPMGAGPAARGVGDQMLRQMEPIGAQGKGQFCVTGNQERDFMIPAGGGDRPAKLCPVWRLVMAEDESAMRGQRRDEACGVGHSLRIAHDEQCRQMGKAAV